MLLCSQLKSVVRPAVTSCLSDNPRGIRVSRICAAGAGAVLVRCWCGAGAVLLVLVPGVLVPGCWWGGGCSLCVCVCVLGCGVLGGGGGGFRSTPSPQKIVLFDCYIIVLHWIKKNRTFYIVYFSTKIYFFFLFHYTKYNTLPWVPTQAAPKSNKNPALTV